MTTWTLVRDSDTKVTIIRDGAGYSDINPGDSLPSNLHAMHWNGTSGDEEIRDPDTGNIVENRTIDNLDDYDWVAPLWQASYDAHLAGMKQAAYDTVIENGGSAEEAQAAADSITSV